MDKYYAGDDVDLGFAIVKDKDGKIPWNITNWKFEFVLMDNEVAIQKKSLGITGGSDCQISIDDPINGIITVHLFKAETVTLSGDYTFFVHRTDENGNSKTLTPDSVEFITKPFNWSL